MMKGYKKSVEEVSEINDALTSIDLAAAVDAGGLAEATSRVAASADLAGVSLNRLLGYEAAVGEAAQGNMSIVGNSLKAIFTRMSSIKAGNLELIDEDGTIKTLSDVETVLNNIGVQLRSSANEFRDFDDVLDDVAERWDNLSSVQQSSVSQAFAGTYQANRFKLLMENYDTALKYEKIANESSGTAMQKFNDAYLNSIEAKQKSLQASFEGLSVNLISRDSINGILEATQALVEFLDKTNLLKGALTGLAMGSVLKGFVALTASITQASMKMHNFQQMLSMARTGNIGADIEKLKLLTEGLSVSQLKAIVSTKELSITQRMAILRVSGMSEAQARATLSTMGLAAAEAGATGSTLSLSAAFKGLWSTLLANPIILISTALTVGMMAWSSYKQSIEDSIQKATDATSAWKESNKAISEQTAKYKELKSQLDSGTLTPSEEYETRKQILDIQTQITSEYGNQVSGIDLVNGSLQTQLGLLQQISAEEAKETLNENREEYKNAEEQMIKDRKYILGNTRAINQDNLRKDIENIVKSFEKEGIYLEETGDGSGTKTIFFDGDASQANESINDLMNKIEELKSKYTDEDSINVLDYILNQSGESLKNENKKILEDYQDNYKTFLQMDMISKGTGKGSVAGTFNEYTEAVQKYNEALSNGDTETINKARSDFASLSIEVDKLLSKDDNGKFAILFDDVLDQLNEAGIKAYDFQEILSGKESNKNQFNKISDDIKDASDKLKGLKLDAVETMDALVTDGKQAGENELWKLAEAWGLSAESTEDEIQSFIDVLLQAGIVSGEVADSAEIASKSFDTYSTSVQKAKEELETLESIMSESISGSGISAENITAFREMFGSDADKALEKTANGYHLNKQVLAELQVQMDTMTKADYLSALSDQYTELQNIEGKISAAEILGQDTSGLQASKNGILDNITSLQDLQYQYEAAASAYQQWQSAMSGGEEGDMYDSIYGNIEKAEELYDKGLTGTNAFREFVDLMSNKDLSTASNEEIIAAYESAMPVIKRYFTEGQEGAQNFLNDIQNINSEWAHMDEDGSWDINFGMGQDQDIADALNMDVEAVQTILRKLSDYGFEINLDEPVASIETLKSQAESASETLSNLGDNINIDLGADSFEDVDKQISSVKDYINEIKNSDLELDVKTDKLDAANSILEYLVARKQEIGQSENVDITLNINEQELQSGYNILNQLKSDLANIQGKVGIDTTGLQTDINNCVAQIEAMSPEMKVALGIQGMSVEQIKAGLMDGSIQVPVDADTAQANSDIDTVKNNNIDDKKFSITANNSQALSSIAVVKAYLSGITNKSVSVTVNKVTNETTNKLSGASPASGISSHMVNGTAHAQGTAFAGGNWGNPTAGKKLVGELGREIVVCPHTGHWYTVGDNGAEFVEIPKNAIVFNHLQSENLLNNGHIIGRGKALASGTALSNGTGKFNIGGSGTKSTSSNSSSKKSSSKSNSSNNSSDASDKADEFKETIDYIEMKIDRIERQIKNLERVAGSTYNTFTKRNTALHNQISSITEEISTQQAGYDRYIQQANSVSLDENYKSQVRNGAIDISTITDETLAENIKEYQQWYEKALDCRDAVEELRESVRDLYTEAFDNVVTLYDGILGQIEHKRNILEGYIDQTEAQGYIISTKYYDTLISNELNNLEELTKERQDLINAMNDAIVNGSIEEESEQWYEFQSEINDVNESIQEANTSLIEFGNSIRDIEWEVFDKIQDRISGITDESDFLVKLLSSNKLFDDKGLITDEGKAAMGLHGVNYNTYMSQADEYRKEMEKIQFELAKDPYNQTLVDRRKELLELQQESILAAEDEKEAIKDLVEDGINKQLDSLKDLIDKYTDMMDTQKDMYDYQKEIAEKQKKINEVEKQFLSFQGDDSEEGAATRQELKNELNELKADLEETQYNKSIAEQKKLLDELYTEYETVLNMRLDNIDLLIMDVTGNVNSESTAIRDTIVSEAESVGYKLTDTMTTVWTDSTNKLTGVITTYGDKFTSSLTGVQTAINELKALIQQAVNASDDKAKTNIENAQKQQTEQTSRPSIPKPPSPTPKPSSSNSGGDGVPRVGDAVTFVNGKYFYSSDGKAPNGSQMLGQTVYITKINNASWAKKPYHISKGSRLGANDLGWVSLDQLKGYKTGAKSIDKDQWAWTNEDAPETVIRKSDGAVLTRVNRGDQIYNSTATKRMWDMANNPTDFISRYYHAPSADDMQSAVRQNATTIQNDIHVEFNLDNVQDPEDFLRFIQKDEKAHKLLQTMMFAELSGRGHFEKFKIKI